MGKAMATTSPLIGGQIDAGGYEILIMDAAHKHSLASTPGSSVGPASAWIHRAATSATAAPYLPDHGGFDFIPTVAAKSAT